MGWDVIRRDGREGREGSGRRWEGQKKTGEKRRGKAWHDLGRQG